MEPINNDVSFLNDDGRREVTTPTLDDVSADSDNIPAELLGKGVEEHLEHRDTIYRVSRRSFLNTIPKQSDRTKRR